MDSSIFMIRQNHLSNIVNISVLLLILLRQLHSHIKNEQIQYNNNKLLKIYEILTQKLRSIYVSGKKIPLTGKIK